MKENHQRVTKEEADKLMKIPGNVKGAVILADLEYIKRKGGEEAIEKIEKRLKELGYPFSLERIKPMNFYPEALSVLVILLAKEVLNLDKEGIFEMGKAAPKLSLFIKLLTRFFISIKRCLEEAPRYWQRHFDFGSLEAKEFNEKEQYAIIRIKGYKFHPLMCYYHKGYFLEIAQLALGKRLVKIEETKCVFKGDPYHEYRITWK
jgi:predicted hydrocarbon binding protein